MIRKFDVSGFELKKARANSDESCLLLVDGNNKIFAFGLSQVYKEISAIDERDASSCLLDTISRFKTEIIDLVLSVHDRDLMYVLTADSCLSLCTVKGAILKIVTFEQTPTCLAIDTIDNCVAIGCESGEILIVLFNDSVNEKDEGFSKPSPNLHAQGLALTTKKQRIKVSTTRITAHAIHSKRVTCLCYVAEDQRFVSSGDDCCVYSFNNEGKILSAVKNLKTPYHYLLPIDRQLVQESTAAHSKKHKQRPKLFKQFAKIINKEAGQAEIVALSKNNKIRKTDVRKTFRLKGLLSYIQHSSSNLQKIDVVVEKEECNELKKLREENDKLRVINSRLLEVCTLLENNNE